MKSLKVSLFPVGLNPNLATHLSRTITQIRDFSFCLNRADRFFKCLITLLTHLALTYWLQTLIYYKLLFPKKVYILLLIT